MVSTMHLAQGLLFFRLRLLPHVHLTQDSTDEFNDPIFFRRVK